MTTLAYYRAGFFPAVREITEWLWRPPVWWGWIIAAPVWLFVAHIIVWYQIQDDRAELLRAS